MKWKLHVRNDAFMTQTEFWMTAHDELRPMTYVAWIERGSVVMREIGPDLEGIRVDQSLGFYPFMIFSTHEIITRSAEEIVGAIAAFHVEQQPGYRPSTSVEIDLLREQVVELKAQLTATREREHTLLREITMEAMKRG